MSNFYNEYFFKFMYKMLKLTLTLKLISFSFLKFDFAMTLNVDWKQLLLSVFHDLLVSDCKDAPGTSDLHFHIKLF